MSKCLPVHLNVKHILAESEPIMPTLTAADPVEHYAGNPSPHTYTHNEAHPFQLYELQVPSVDSENPR